MSTQKLAVDIDEFKVQFYARHMSEEEVVSKNELTNYRHWRHL